jgi:hypothetical protein
MAKEGLNDGTGPNAPAIVAAQTTFSRWKWTETLPYKGSKVRAYRKVTSEFDATSKTMGTMSKM